jgi:hypothetical protein
MTTEAKHHGYRGKCERDVQVTGQPLAQLLAGEGIVPQPLRPLFLAAHDPIVQGLREGKLGLSSAIQRRIYMPRAVEAPE